MSRDKATGQCNASRLPTLQFEQIGQRTSRSSVPRGHAHHVGHIELLSRDHAGHFPLLGPSLQLNVATLTLQGRIYSGTFCHNHSNKADCCFTNGPCEDIAQWALHVSTLVRDLHRSHRSDYMTCSIMSTLVTKSPSQITFADSATFGNSVLRQPMYFTNEHIYCIVGTSDELKDQQYQYIKQWLSFSSASYRLANQRQRTCTCQKIVRDLHRSQI